LRLKMKPIPNDDIYFNLEVLMKATPVLDYTVPESVKTLQKKISADDAKGVRAGTCTCARSSNVYTDNHPCPCGCGTGYSTFL
jgi:hypothetical protein